MPYCLRRHEIFGVSVFSALHRKIMIIFLNQSTQKTWVDQSVPDSHMYGAKTPLAWKALKGRVTHIFHKLFFRKARPLRDP